VRGHNLGNTLLAATRATQNHIPILGDYVKVLADLSGKALNAEEENSKFGTAFNYLAKQMLPVLQILPFINKGVKNYADNVRGATSATDDFERIAVDSPRWDEIVSESE
jgi:hypothetical protein